jgi:hypothetical protein
MLAAMRRRILLASLVVLLCSAFQARGFSGCGSGPGGGAMLPTGGPEGCFLDEDCPGDACTTRACVAGRCVEVGILDRDFDGVSPPPCGEDCDDSNANLYPGALEICDGSDQDCDAVIDEEASAEPVRWIAGRFLSDLPSAVAVRTTTGRPEVFVTEALDGVVLVRRLDPFGGELGAIELMAGGVRSHDLVRQSDGTITLVGLAPDERRLYVGDISDRLMVELREVPTGEAAFGVTAAAYPGGVAAVWVEGGGEIWLWTSELSGPVRLGPLPETGPLGVSPEGDALVVTARPDLALFVDPRSGIVSTARNLDAPRTWAEGAVAAGGAATFVLSRDAFDLSIARISPTGTLRFTPAPSVPLLGVPGRIDAFGDRVVITRVSSETSSGAQIGILDGSLLLRASFDTTGFGPDLSSGWDVSLDEEILTVITTFPTQIDGVTLYCGSR